MSDIAIRVEGLSKQYYIGAGKRQYDRLGDQVVDFMLSPLRRAGNLLRGQLTGAAELDKPFWALQDVCFDIKYGDVVGIIGHNGAGKSTLLKILSRITRPTHGWAKVYGRVSSLLEVGTGFHPELTGRENTYLNGAILGMSRAEIDRKFEAIVDFAEIETFIDTPVKHYSSGMYVRLAFSVAAHLEPEILLVDEVLAVGDVAFQKKCLGKMDNVSRQGRTVIFVSHNMNALQRLCPQSILLNRGQLVEQGNTADVITRYLSTGSTTIAMPGDWTNLDAASREGSGQAQFTAVSYTSLDAAKAYHPFSSGPLDVAMKIRADRPRTVQSIAAIIYDQYGTKLVNADTLSLGQAIRLNEGENCIRLRIDKLYLTPGIYTLALWVADPPNDVYDWIPNVAKLEIVELESDRIRVPEEGLVTCDFKVLDVA